MFETLSIKSKSGDYSVEFMPGCLSNFFDLVPKNSVCIVDAGVGEILENQFPTIFDNGRILFIDATENAKSLERTPSYVHRLMELEFKRGETIVGIGGGITQDITCFIASTLMRGVAWQYFPTTLLAQCDSCIGSKSSINAGNLKNIIGTFYPPEKIFIDVNVLGSLQERDIQSGLGEMFKVHAIDCPTSFDKFAASYEKILTNKDVMQTYIYESLLIKKRLIELDEFDTGPRNVMNYGHSFGHAIETATDYQIPHGIAVTIGIDMANFVSKEIGVGSEEQFARMHTFLSRNCSNFRSVNIDQAALFTALLKDKKNTRTHLRLILPDKTGSVFIGLYDDFEKIKSAISGYLAKYQTGT